MPKQKPVIMKSSLSGRYYLATSYIDMGEGQYCSRKTIDITESVEPFIRAAVQEELAKQNAAELKVNRRDNTAVENSRCRSGSDVWRADAEDRSERHRHKDDVR